MKLKKIYLLGNDCFINRTEKGNVVIGMAIQKGKIDQAQVTKESFLDFVKKNFKKELTL